jgi:hypothetical protein
MKPFAVIPCLVLLASCQNSLPVGIPPVVVYVVDGMSQAELCDATVTINGVKADEDQGMIGMCEYLSAVTLNVGDAYTVTASDTDYSMGSSSGTVQSTGSTVTISLMRTVFPDAGMDAKADVATDAPNDTTTSDVTSDSPEDVTDE